MAFIKAKFWDRGRCGWKIQDNNWTLSRFIPTKHQGHLCSLIHIISYPAFNTHSLYQKTCSLLAFIAATVLVSLQLSKALSLRQDTLFLKFHPMYSGTLLPQPFPTGRPSSSPVQDLHLPLWYFQRFLSAHLSHLSRPLWRAAQPSGDQPLLQTFYHQWTPWGAITGSACPAPAHIISPMFITIPVALSFLIEQKNKKKSRCINAKLRWHFTESMKANKTDDFLKQKHYYSHNNTYQGKICSLK